MKKLYSSQIKMIKSLQNKKGRDDTGLFVSEGIKTVRELLTSGIKVEFLVFDPEFENEQKNELIMLSKGADICSHTIGSVTAMASSEGVLAVAKLPGFKRPELFFKNKKNILGLFSINDPGNIGTIIRTAKWFGLDGIILYGDCADVYSPKVLRSSMGAVFGMDFIRFRDFTEGKNFVKSFHKISTYLNLDHSFHKNRDSGNILFLGNESNGIDNSLQAEFDSNFKIPSEGSFESLNVSVAGGIIMYEIFK